MLHLFLRICILLDCADSAFDICSVWCCRKRFRNVSKITRFVRYASCTRVFVPPKPTWTFKVKTIKASFGLRIWDIWVAPNRNGSDYSIMLCAGGKRQEKSCKSSTNDRIIYVASLVAGQRHDSGNSFCDTLYESRRVLECGVYSYITAWHFIFTPVIQSYYTLTVSSTHGPLVPQ